MDVEPAPPWLTLETLIGSPEILSQRISGVRSALGAAAGRSADEIDHRVAASVAQLGLVARLISPVLGAAVLSSVPLRVEAATAWWQPVLGGPYPLSLPESAAVTAADEPAVRAVLLELLDGPIRGIVEVVAARSVSPLVLWGNVASAINGSASMLVTLRPEAAESVRRMAGWMLGYPRLRGGFTGVPAAERGAGVQFQRRSCCLIYRISEPPSNAYCGDCIHLLPLSSVLP
ncbi:FhuF-like iron-sulfur protein [Jatrophihabitans sp. GAS493]|uniref:(2Fe-2S)-binding protein n=1 Tax=Jatrophihabitans sp. GAS493 TaxID=1907575 RepID=UPI000BB865D4|nr:(2Fe-2S)-binding protein [Jatrophihabitans sp. GAS493]SOD71747.1 FhuF-like iron-sulfur protein [Jatrophihabitans sp. GAS493]